ncbi:MAG: histidine phosphatase family protein [Burkholderiales bacterium]|nr:histidine phosphatase family protein [Burkholderiales bacterium]
MRRRQALGWTVCLALPAQATDLLQDGRVVLVRHAHAPGGGDPPGFQLGDCGTQRNLDDTGRAQAHRLGEQLRASGLRIGAVWTSQWCRTRETAELAFPGLAKEQPAFNSFFGAPEREAAQTRQASALLRAWRGPGLLVVVTHQVNISALTGVVPASGEGVVQSVVGERLRVEGRLPP